jgi:hypothetical protein
MTRLVNNTLSITLFLGANCPLHKSQKKCIDQHLGSFFSDRTVFVRGFYNISNTTGTHWAYGKPSALIYRSWSILAISDKALPMQFMEELQNGLDQVVECEAKVGKKMRVIRGVTGVAIGFAAIGVAGGLVYYMSRKVPEREVQEPLRQLTNYGSV